MDEDAAPRLPELAESAVLASSRQAACTHSMAKRRRVLLVRGCSFANKTSPDSENLAKRVVQTLQADNTYPNFKDDNWSVQIKFNSHGDIMLRPVQDEVPDPAIVVVPPESPSPVGQTWKRDQLSCPLPTESLPSPLTIGIEDDAGERGTQAGVAAPSTPAGGAGVAAPSPPQDRRRLKLVA